MKMATLIAIADLHLLEREDQPEAWTESYWEAQAETVAVLKELQQDHLCPVLLAGDVFDYWKPSPFLIGWAIENLPQNIIAVAGQHDLPQHNLSLYPKSGLNVLERAGIVKVLAEGGSALVRAARSVHGFPFGVSLSPSPEKGAVALAHAMTYKRRPPYPGCEAPSSSEMFRLLAGYELIVTGDNHESFVVEMEDSFHVNPGSVMQLTAAQIGHKPAAFLWYEDERRVEPFYLPNNSSKISRAHLEAEREKDERLEAFVRKLEKDASSRQSLDFEGNLERFMEKSKTKKSVRDVVWRVVER